MQLKYIEQTHVIHDQHKHLPPPLTLPRRVVPLSLSLSLYDLLVSLTRYLKPKSIKHSYHIYIYIYTLLRSIIRFCLSRIPALLFLQ